MSVSIPLFSDLIHYKQEIELNLSLYVFDILWNRRSSSWTISIFSADNEPIIIGLVAVLNYDLLHQFKANPLIPRGSLFCIDTTGSETSITKDNFGKTISLVFIGDGEQ